MPESPPEAAMCAHIMLDLGASSPSLLIEQLAAGFLGAAEAPAPRALATAALEREAQASTYLGHATALPHARLPSVARLAVVFGRTRQPVLWTPQGDRVQLVFLAAVPAAQPRRYLDFMRTLGRALHDEANVAALLGLPDEAAVRAWLATHLELR
jgi:mannitol/fructose-specific phosphotransferase system IIA component (Ntr-type)